MTNAMCPMLGAPCLGKGCAVAVRLDHPLVSAYDVYWVCGLTNDGEMKHRKPRYIASEARR